MAHCSHRQCHHPPRATGITGMLLMMVLLLLTLFQESGSSSPCHFAEPYRGRWYQPGMTSDVITINSHTMSTKGKCLEQKNDMFLMLDTDEDCKRCLLIVHRHHNILQYKESYCIASGKSDSFQAVCSQIRVETTLYTLVRDNSVPIPCPLQNSYSFKYKNGSLDFCDEPRSEMDICASEAKLRFRFRHCQGVPDTFDNDIELRCLATWKDGSAMYVYGNARGEGIIDKDHQYRCFIYEILGSDVHLSLSADAFCWGLTSPTDGEVVLELSRDPEEFKRSKTSCTFPAWVGANRWRDLSGRHVYELDSDNSTIRKSRRRDGHVAVAFKCAHAQPNVAAGDHNNNNNNDKSVTFVSRVTKGCSTHYQCVQITRLHDNILQLSLGISNDSAKNINCNAPHSTTATTTSSIHTLYGEDVDVESTDCPMPGKFTSTTAVSGCVTNLHIGCNSTSVVSIDDSCSKRPEGNLECLYHWSSSSGQTMLLGRKLGDDSNTTNCFAMSRSGNLLSFHTDSQCNTHVDHIFKDAIKLELEAQPGACATGSPVTQASHLTSLLLLAMLVLHVMHSS